MKSAVEESEYKTEEISPKYETKKQKIKITTGEEI